MPPLHRYESRKTNGLPDHGRLRPLPVPRRRGPDKASTPISRPSSSRKSWSSRRAIPRMAISRPTPRWSSPSRSARTRARSRPQLAERLQGRPRGRSRRSRRPRLPQFPPRRRRSGTPCSAPRSSSGADFGRADIGKGEKVNVEYVSANPTGPMHVGHTRGAVFGDALASLMAYAGYDVTREYYINDAGGQIETLAQSAFLRYREALGEVIEIPRGLYPGDYLIPVGQELAAELRRHAPLQARGRVAADRQGSRPRRDDGAHPRRPRQAQHPARRVLLRADAARAGQATSTSRSTGCGTRASSTRAGSSRPRAWPTRTGRIASRPCSAPRTSATTPIARWSSPTAATPISPPTSPTTATSCCAASTT